MDTSLKRFTIYILSMLCMLYIFWDLDIKVFIEAINLFKIFPLIIAQGIILILYLPISQRLRRLSDFTISLKACSQAAFTGMAINTILPMRLGEGAKAILLDEPKSIPFKQIIGIIFWERFSDLNMLLILVILSSFLTTQYLIVAPLVLLVMAIWLILLLFARQKKLASRLLAPLPWIHLKQTILNMTSILSKKLTFRHLVPLAAYTGAIWSISFIGFYIALCYGSPITLSSQQILIVFVASIIGMTIPSAPAGLGVFESVIVGALQFLEIPKEQAVAFALVIHALQTVLPTLIGAMFIPRLSQSSSSLIGQLRATIQPE